MADSPVLAAADAYRAQLARLETAATERLIGSYLSSWDRLEAMLNKLLLEVGDEMPTLGQLTRIVRYKSLMAQVVTELTGLQTLTANEIGLTTEMIALGEQYARELMGIQIGGTAAIASQFNVLSVDTIKIILGFLSIDGPLYARLAMLTGVNAQFVSDAIIQGITLGWNPRKIAAYVRSAFGRGLSDALRFVRTAQLWAYREASGASMVANQQILDGWVWYAELGSERTCMSCVAMHGTIHPVDEPLNDHHNGRCAQVPIVQGYTNPVTETGVEWFEKQPEAVQRARMGAEYYQAWKDGLFGIGDMSTTRRDEVYGDMRSETPLWQLLGAEPPLKTVV
jgi:hypothetical protein